MSEKHYPYIGGSFDRIVFDGDGSVWVPESENAKLREQVTQLQNDWESEHDYADQMEAREKKAVGENAKLRKVCTDACRAICKMYVYIDGEWNHGDAHADPTYGPILRRMRELGIEGE